MVSTPLTSQNEYPSLYIEGEDFTEQEINEAIDLMGEDDFLQDYIETPELMGGFLKKWLRKKRKRLKKLRAKMRGMSRKEKRKFRKKVRRGIIRGMLTRLIPGRRTRRVIQAIRLERRLQHRDPSILRSLIRKRKARKNLQRRTIAQQNRELRSREERFNREERLMPTIKQPVFVDNFERENIVPESENARLKQTTEPTPTIKTGIDIKKILPLAIGAGAIAYMLTKKK